METTYGYDNADRLLNITHRAGAATLENLVYEYDANGARTRFTRNAAQPVRSDSASPTCGTTDYTFDVRGRLTGISGFDGQCSPLTASFRYDALGRRYEKTVNGITTKYVYDGLDIVQEIQNGTVTANYIRTMNIDEPLMRIKSDGTIRFYKTDALGSVIALTDETGAVRTTYSYDPFGNVTISGEASDNPFQYTGRENDNTGLYYYRARYYNPELQRFISEDPIGLAGGDVNFYAYVGNSPVNRKDPTGLHWVCDQIHGCYFHTSCINNHEHPNRDAASQSCHFQDPPIEIPPWVCKMGIKAGCNLLCKRLGGDLATCQATCTAAAELVCPKKCE